MAAMGERDSPPGYPARDVKTLQKFASVHASFHNHFNQQRHLNHREIFKQNRAAALSASRGDQMQTPEWQQLAA